MKTKKNTTPKRDPDHDLYLKIKNENCEASLKTIIEKHTPLYYKICQKFSFNLSNRGFYLDDLYKDSHYIIYKAINSFDLSRKIKLSTWIGLCAKYHCLTILTNLNHEITTVSDESFYDFAAEIDNREELKDYILNLTSRLNDKRIDQIIKLRYFDSDSEGGNGKKMTWKKIGKKLNLSNQTVINLFNSSLKILKEKIKNKEGNDFI